MYPTSKPPETFKHILPDLTSLSTVQRPSTPQSLKPFVILHDPVTLRIYSTLLPVPPPPSPPHQSFSLSPKRPVKRDPWPRDQAIERGRGAGEHGRADYVNNTIAIPQATTSENLPVKQPISLFSELLFQRMREV